VARKRERRAAKLLVDLVPVAEEGRSGSSFGVS
jgi:hypothetical protein